MALCVRSQEPRRSYVTIASNQDTPEDTQVQSRVSKRFGAIGSAEAAAADAAGPSSINSKNKANIGGGRIKYGSTDGNSFEHHMENGAARPTAAMDAGEISTAGGAAVCVWNNAATEHKESAALLPRASRDTSNVMPMVSETAVSSLSGENDGSFAEEIDDEGEGDVGDCSLGAISRPLAACLFGYFVNKLVTEVIS